MASFMLKLSHAALEGVQLLIGKLLAVIAEQMHSKEFSQGDSEIQESKATLSSSHPTVCHSSQGPIQYPAPVLLIDNNEYHLAAIMYGSGGHFCYTTMVKGGALFYDGIKPRKLQWLMSNKKNMAMPDGFQMSQVWYLKQEAQGSQCGQQELECR
jgi:hypothetical protein